MASISNLVDEKISIFLKLTLAKKTGGDVAADYDVWATLKASRGTSNTLSIQLLASKESKTTIFNTDYSHSAGEANSDPHPKTTPKIALGPKEITYLYIANPSLRILNKMEVNEATGIDFSNPKVLDVSCNYSIHFDVPMDKKISYGFYGCVGFHYGDAPVPGTFKLGVFDLENFTEITSLDTPDLYCDDKKTVEIAGVGINYEYLATGLFDGTILDVESTLY